MIFLSRALLDPQARGATRKSKARKRKITWYNPPWDNNVKTNLGGQFLLIVDKCFPKNHPLNKIFNRHTLKLSYSCMPNMKAVITSHNKIMLAQDSATAAPSQPLTCNYRNKPECPLQGKHAKKRGLSSDSCHRNDNRKLCRTRFEFQRTV